MSFALDVNILLYASDSGSPHQSRAQAFLNSCATSGEAFYLAWPTIMSYLRIATHPSIFDNPLSPSEVAANVEALLAVPTIRLLAEEEGFWKLYRTTTAETPARGNMVPDAHLATLLLQHGVNTIYTSDKDFLKFEFLKVVNPFKQPPSRRPS